MPERTNEDDAAGVSGFTVVPARRNDTTPKILVAAPSNAIATAMEFRSGITKVNVGAVRALNHISAAVNRTRASGGIFSSRARIPASWFLREASFIKRCDRRASSQASH